MSTNSALLLLCYGNQNSVLLYFFYSFFFFISYRDFIRNSPLILCLIGLTFRRAMRHSQSLEGNWWPGKGMLSQANQSLGRGPKPMNPQEYSSTSVAGPCGAQANIWLPTRPSHIGSSFAFHPLSPPTAKHKQSQRNSANYSPQCLGAHYDFCARLCIPALSA